MAAVSAARAFAEARGLLSGEPVLIPMETMYGDLLGSTKMVFSLPRDEVVLVEEGHAGYVLQPFQEIKDEDGHDGGDYIYHEGKRQVRHAVAHRWVRYHEESDTLFCQSFGGKNYPGVAHRDCWFPFHGLDEHGRRILNEPTGMPDWIKSIMLTNNGQFGSTYVMRWLDLQGSLATAKLALSFNPVVVEGKGADQYLKDQFAALFGYILTSEVLVNHEALRQVPVEVLDIVTTYAQ